MNKLLFKYERNFCNDIILVANNHKDLEDYLNENFDFYKVVVKDDFVSIIESEGFETDFINLVWVPQV